MGMEGNQTCNFLAQSPTAVYYDSFLCDIFFLPLVDFLLFCFITMNFPLIKLDSRNEVNKYGHNFRAGMSILGF